MATLTQASRQWAIRPSDERFTSLHELHDKVQGERARSRGAVVSNRKIEVIPVPGDETRGIAVRGEGGNIALPSHYAFGQLAERAGAPASYLRSLPAPIVADAMNYGLKFNGEAKDVGLLLTRSDVFDPTVATPPALQLRAATGPKYGRIWNSQVSSALIERFGDGVTGDFKVPGEFGRDVTVTKDNTTLYASDRDMFVFLADEKNRITVNNRRDGRSGSLARGFFVWNSEVGSASIGAAFFLFDYACSNRIVWGAEGYKEIRLRHTASAPDRWLEEIAPVLVAYSKEASTPIEAQLAAAQNRKVDDVAAFLKTRYSIKLAEQIQQAHIREENRPIENLWDVVTGITAHAKTIRHQDDRVNLERTAGKILDLAA
jgi:hypothetical protein